MNLLRSRMFLWALPLMVSWSTCLAEDPWLQVETEFRSLPMDARRMTGPLFWLHGDETKERLQSYVDKIAEGGNGCFTAESRPHKDWLGPGWYRDLEFCLDQAKANNMQMWIFDERWWPSQSVAGTVPPKYAAKTLVAEKTRVYGPANFQSEGHSGDRYIATLAGLVNRDGEVIGESLVDLAAYIDKGKLSWKAPNGEWQVIRFHHQQAPGLGQVGGRELSVDGASRDCTDWFLKTVYQPHYDRFKDDFGKSIRGFFYDEPETCGDWGSEVPVILHEWGVDWKKAYVAYTGKLAGDDGIAARYQYMEALAEAWGRVMYGGMTEWCEKRGVQSIGHFMEHNNLYLRPSYCAGDMMRLQKYSSMGGIDLVVEQMYPGGRPETIYQTPKLGSSISHVYGKRDDVAMCEIFGGYGQKLSYPVMKWLTDQHQVRGINFLIPHSFNPRAPKDRDYPPYFYNDGREPRWPLYKVWADYSSRLSLMLTGGHHVCPIAVLFSGNAGRVGDYVTPEQLTTALQDVQYDADWLPFEAFASEESKVELRGRGLALHGERYQVLVVPPTEVIPVPVLAKLKQFMDAGGVVIAYGRLPSKSASVGVPSAMVAHWCGEIWGDAPVMGAAVCKTTTGGGRSYFLPERPTSAMLAEVLQQDAGVMPVVEVSHGDPGEWLHVLHRVKDERHVYLICNQEDRGEGRDLVLQFHGMRGYPEVWDPMRNEMTSVPFKREGSRSEITLRLEPMESVLVVFNPELRGLPVRLTPAALREAQEIHLESEERGGSGYRGILKLADEQAHQRLVLVMEGLGAEEAARVRINGKEVGGFIGKPHQLDVGKWLKAGDNTVEIVPFSPGKVCVKVCRAR